MCVCVCARACMYAHMCLCTDAVMSADSVGSHRTKFVRNTLQQHIIRSIFIVQIYNLLYSFSTKNLNNFSSISCQRNYVRRLHMHGSSSVGSQSESVSDVFGCRFGCDKMLSQNLLFVILCMCYGISVGLADTWSSR